MDKTSPAGQHKNIFCQVVAMKDGEPVVHNVGGTELRIDVPLPPKADAPPPAADARGDEAGRPAASRRRSG